MPDTDEHQLRTFLLGPLGGTRWECWCGELSNQEFMDQTSAQRDHQRHRDEQTRGHLDDRFR